MTRRIYVVVAFVLGLVIGVWADRTTQPAVAQPDPVVEVVYVPEVASVDRSEPATLRLASLRPAIPACYEDERVWGVGDYRGRLHGGWTRYVCRHVDWIYDLGGGE